MNESYKDFVENGAVIYPGKADSLTAHAGNGRIELTWVLTDPKVTACRIYWNQGQDSLDIQVGKVSRLDTIRAMIENLQQGIYLFTVYSYDENEHVSVGAEVLGTVYGEQYSSTVVNRFMENLSVVNGQVVIAWSIPDDGTIGEEITYTDKKGNDQKMFVPVEDTAKIINLKPGSDFQYRTLYLPDSLAIDTFYSTYQAVKVDAKFFQTELDKSAFEAVHLPTDTYEPNSSDNSMDKMWDGIYGVEKPSFLTAPGTGVFPQWFTFDLGVSAKLARMKLYQRGNGVTGNRIYNGGNIRKFEIWGSDKPDPDGSWDSWTLLMTAESKPPSGASAGEATAEDIAYALNGEEFTFPDNTPPVHYIRIKTFGNWDPKGRIYINIGEITFWGEIQ